MLPDTCPHDEKIRKIVNDTMEYSGFCYLCDMKKPVVIATQTRRYDSDAADERRAKRKKRACGTSRFGKFR